MLETELETELINSTIFFPRDKPSVYIATSTDINIAITGLPIKTMISLNIKFSV